MYINGQVNQGPFYSIEHKEKVTLNDSKVIGPPYLNFQGNFYSDQISCCVLTTLQQKEQVTW